MFRALNRRGPDEHRLASRSSLFDVFDDGGILRTLGAIDEISLVIAHHRPMGWDRGHLKVVDLAELFCFGHCGTSHAGKFSVETEVVLERDRCERHRLALHMQPLLCFDGLV